MIAVQVAQNHHFLLFAVKGALPDFQYKSSPWFFQQQSLSLLVGLLPVASIPHQNFGHYYQ